MSSSQSHSREENISGQKRKGSELLSDIKGKLVRFGLALRGRKSGLSLKLQQAESLNDLIKTKPAGENWSIEEMTMLTDFLPGSDLECWEPADVLFLQPILNAHSHSADAPAAITTKASDINEFYRRHLAPTGRAKALTVSADELVPMMTTLRKKAHVKWGKKEVDLLLENFANVATIDTNISSAAAVDLYLLFFADLTAFYVRRPDIKAIVDPDVVIFDLSPNVDGQLYATQLANYTAAPVGGGARTLPVHLGAFPAQWNPGPVATVFPMTSYPAATHFVGFMRARVPNLRAVVLPNYGGPNLLF